MPGAHPRWGAVGAFRLDVYIYGSLSRVLHPDTLEYYIYIYIYSPIHRLSVCEHM